MLMRLSNAIGWPLQSSLRSKVMTSVTRRALCVGIAAAASTVLAKNPNQTHPDVVAVKVMPRGGNTFDFDVTVSSPYDTASRYADAVRAVGPDGKLYGERIFLHDHADEQPFTRDMYGVQVPTGLKTVTIQGRDQKHGWGGKTFEAALPGR
jgi:hypothetical protein